MSTPCFQDCVEKKNYNHSECLSSKQLAYQNHEENWLISYNHCMNNMAKEFDDCVRLSQQPQKDKK